MILTKNSDYLSASQSFLLNGNELEYHNRRKFIIPIASQ